MAKFGWGYKATNLRLTKTGAEYTLTMSKLRICYEILKYIFFEMQINIRINHAR